MTACPFIQHDGGRSTSRRPKQKNDCTVRALALVTGKPYDYIYDLVAADGRKCGRGFDIRRFFTPRRGDNFQALLNRLGLASVQWTAFQAIKGQRRMNPRAFAAQYPSGRFICKTAGHVYAVIDGTVYDTSPAREDRCIYGAWRIEL